MEYLHSSNACEEPLKLLFGNDHILLLNHVHFPLFVGKLQITHRKRLYFDQVMPGVEIDEGWVGFQPQTIEKARISVHCDDHRDETLICSRMFIPTTERFDKGVVRFPIPWFQ